MAVGTPTNLVANHSTVDGTSFNTASFTPTSGAKTIAFICVGHRTVTPVAPSSLSGHGTWTKIADLTTSNNTWNCTLWEGTGDGAAGALTINVASTAETCTWRVIEATGAVAGQIKTLATSVADPSLTLNSAVSSGGAVCGFLLNNNTSATITAGSGYTEITPQTTSSTAPVFIQAAEQDLTGTTTVAINCSGTAVKALLAVELDPSGDIWNVSPSDPVGVTDKIAKTVRKGFVGFQVGITDRVFITLKKVFKDNVGIPDTHSETEGGGPPPPTFGPNMSLVDQKRVVVQTTFGLTDQQVAKLSIQDLVNLYWSGDFPALHPYDGSESGLTPTAKFSTMDHHAVVQQKKTGILNWIRDIV